MNINSFLSAGLVGASIVVVGAQFAPAQAFTLGATNITNNGNLDVADNFSIDVTDAGFGQVSFTFSNVASVAYATITDIYFGTSTYFGNYFSTAGYDDSSTGLVSYSGNFQTKTNGSTKPGGGVDWFAKFIADADSPAGFGGNGIDPGDTWTLTLNLLSGVTFDDVQSGFESGELVIAFHGQSIGGSGGYSDWFSSDPDLNPEDIPEPITLLGTGAALGFGAAFKKRLSQRKKQEA